MLGAVAKRFFGLSSRTAGTVQGPQLIGTEDSDGCPMGGLCRGLRAASMWGAVLLLSPIDGAEMSGEDEKGAQSSIPRLRPRRSAPPAMMCRRARRVTIPHLQMERTSIAYGAIIHTLLDSTANLHIYCAVYFLVRCGYK